MQVVFLIMEDTLVKLTKLQYIIKLFFVLSFSLKHPIEEQFFDESVSDFHAMAALCLKVIWRISDFGLGSSMLMVVLRQ